MISWLKFYFLGFLYDKYAKEGAERSFFNALLSFILMIVLVCGGLTAGYTASFGTHYSNAKQFRAFLYAAFADGDSSNRIDLTVDGDFVTAKIPDGSDCVNGLQSDRYTLNGYRLVVDTRAATDAYDDFSFICRNGSGNEITYEEYRTMSEADRSSGYIGVEYSGKTLDTAARQTEYIAFLDRVATEGDTEFSSDIAAEYKKLKEDYSGGGITDGEYADSIYLLYARAYYPSFAGVETYGAVPTVKNYYLIKSSEEEGKFCMILDDTFVCSFETDSGIKIDFGGYYTKASSKAVTNGSMTAEEMQKSVDRFIADVFSSGGGYNIFVYFINTVKILILLIVALMIAALVVFIVCRWRKIEFGCKFGGALKVECSYLLWASFIAFICAIIFPFFLARALTYNLIMAIVIAIPVLRTVALLITEFVRNERERQLSKAENVDAE